MPQNKFALARYRIIDSLLRKNEYVKSRVIVEHCRAITGFCVSVRTIQMDIDTMKHDSILGMHAPIAYCRRRQAYYYEDPAYTFSTYNFTEDEVSIIEKLLRASHPSFRDDELQTLVRIRDKFKMLI